jgi:hypothetical protein
VVVTLYQRPSFTVPMPKVTQDQWDRLFPKPKKAKPTKRA